MIAPQVNSISTVRLDLVRETPLLQENSPLVNKSKQPSQSYVFCILAIQSSYSASLKCHTVDILTFYKEQRAPLRFTLNNLTTSYTLIFRLTSNLSFEIHFVFS